MDFDSQPVWPTIWVMFFASHQALLSGNNASLLMGGGAATTRDGSRMPSVNQHILHMWSTMALRLSKDSELRLLRGNAPSSFQITFSEGRRAAKIFLVPPVHSPAVAIKGFAVSLTQRGVDWSNLCMSAAPRPGIIPETYLEWAAPV